MEIPRDHDEGSFARLVAMARLFLPDHRTRRASPHGSLTPRRMIRVLAHSRCTGEART